MVMRGNKMKYEVQLEDAACPLCCSKNDELVLTGRDLLHDLPGEFDVVRCSSCGLMRTNPRPSPDTIGFYYPDDYGPYLGTRIQHTNKKATNTIKSLLKPLFRKLFNFNTTPLPQQTVGRLLEIGCASGSFLHLMAAKGWQVQGVEFSEKAAQATQELGYGVHVGPLETTLDTKESYDLIVGWMVLEHLHDPIGGLRKLREWAKQGAWLVLSVPNAGSFEFNFFKSRWYALQLPTHLHHFTPDTVEKVLAASGWKLEKIHHQRVLSNLIASTGYLLRDKGCLKLGQLLVNFPERAGRLNYVVYPLAWLLSLFGQTGRMTIWAKVE